MAQAKKPDTTPTTPTTAPAAKKTRPRAYRSAPSRDKKFPAGGTIQVKFNMTITPDGAKALAIDGHTRANDIVSLVVEKADLVALAGAALQVEVERIVENIPRAKAAAALKADDKKVADLKEKQTKQAERAKTRRELFESGDFSFAEPTPSDTGLPSGESGKGDGDPAAASKS